MTPHPDEPKVETVLTRNERAVDAIADRLPALHRLLSMVYDQAVAEGRMTRAEAALHKHPVLHEVGAAISSERRAADDLIERAWGVIANAGGGDWSKENEVWNIAAKAWRALYHKRLDSARSAQDGGSGT